MVKLKWKGIENAMISWQIITTSSVKVTEAPRNSREVYSFQAEWLQLKSLESDLPNPQWAPKT